MYQIEEMVVEKNSGLVRIIDERILKELEFLVYPEVSYVLGIDEKDILKRLTKNE